MEDRNLAMEILILIFAIIGVIATVNFIFS